MQVASISTVPMSRLEPDKFLDYDKLADKLKVRAPGGWGADTLGAAPYAGRLLAAAPRRRGARQRAAELAQIVRRRLNKPMTLAEKVRRSRLAWRHT